jgi:hypothetical protein
MRFLFWILTLGCGGTSLVRRFRYPANWVDHPHADLVIIFGFASLGLLVADFLLNTRPVPGEEQSGWLEWGLRVAALGLAAGALYLSQN